MNDVRSRVHVSKCVGDTGIVDVSIMSERVKIKYLMKLRVGNEKTRHDCKNR